MVFIQYFLNAVIYKSTKTHKQTINDTQGIIPNHTPQQHVY